jgi:hypothetical protein
MSSAVSLITLTEVTFPDITGKTIGAYGQVFFGAGTYTSGGIPFGLIAFADARTVDFNGFLRNEVFDETYVNGSNYTFKYIPTTDSLVIYLNGTELTNGASVSISDTVMFHAVWDRTTTRG